MAFSGEGAASGAMSGAAAGSAGGPWGAAIGGVVGGVAGGFMGGKKPKAINLDKAKQQIMFNTERNKFLNDQTNLQLKPLTATYEAASEAARKQLQAAFDTNKADYLGATDKNTTEAQNLLRSNLYAKEFPALTDALRSVRETSAAGGGLNTGSYQQAVKETGINTANNIAGGEADIQLQGLQNRQGAQQQVYAAFNSLSEKLNASQMDTITKVMDTGREDILRKSANEMGINDQETEALVQLMNYQSGADFAYESANIASDQQMLKDALAAGGTMAGNLAGSARNKATEVSGTRSVMSGKGSVPNAANETLMRPNFSRPNYQNRNFMRP